MLAFWLRAGSELPWLYIYSGPVPSQVLYHLTLDFTRTFTWILTKDAFLPHTLDVLRLHIWIWPTTLCYSIKFPLAGLACLHVCMARDLERKKKKHSQLTLAAGNLESDHLAVWTLVGCDAIFLSSSGFHFLPWTLEFWVIMVFPNRTARSTSRQQGESSDCIYLTNPQKGGFYDLNPVFQGLLWSTPLLSGTLILHATVCRICRHWT
ncbi:hypothetical protein LX36DRAFT_169653 [Colletotrichum falcatum]|nr:hypothetical protein LX36DRAFT_169653 [Colletotrichum falcatum]